MIITESMIMTVSTKRRSPWKTFAVVLSAVLLFGGAVMGVTYFLYHGFGRSTAGSGEVRIINQAGGSQNRYETPKERRKWFRKRQKKTERK